MTCRICNNTENNRTYDIPEMMFGYRDSFVYFQCFRCHCLQIATVPPDMSKYYPAHYYSFDADPGKKYKNPIKREWVKFRDHYSIFDKGLLTALTNTLYPNNRFRILSQVKLTFDSRILDVGCGSGWYTYGLREIGFRNVAGIDPYVEKDISYGNGLTVLKKSIDDMQGAWDLIMFHHSFEHVQNPLENLVAVSKLLVPGGVCLIRVPTVSSYAWEHYREDWVDLDAPRHYYLHSVESMKLLAEKAGLRLKEVIYDSTEFQFIGSELYKKGIPLVSADVRSIFGKSQIKKWKQEAQQLNSESRGDQAAFFLVKDQ